VSVSVVPATDAERALILGLAEFYIYDFSEMEPVDSPALEVNAHGLFGAAEPFGVYWEDPKRWPMLIKRGETPIGFALLNTLSHLGEAIDRNMGEFFVLRKHRGGGVAAEAVRQVFAMHPGEWEVAVAERNVKAKAFWPRAIAAAANVSGIRELKGDGVRWNGPVYRFNAARV
jgi:predicted acetyltransferase